MLSSALRLIDTLNDDIDLAVYSKLLIKELLYCVLKECHDGRLYWSLRQQGQVQQISKIVAYIHKNLDKTLYMEELAKRINMSHTNFHKKFKIVMGMSPLQYTKQVRLNKAKTLLSEGYSVAKASLIVGYNSSTQFSREYKRLFRIPPSMEG